MDTSPTLTRRSLPLLAGAALATGALALSPPAHADPGAEDAAAAGADLLHRIGVTGRTARTRSADGPVWSPVATGFASVPTAELPHGAVGGMGGPVSTVRDIAALTAAVAGDEPKIVLVKGTLEAADFGSMIDVGANTTIAGIGARAELVAVGLRLLNTSNVVIRNLTFRDSYVPGDWDGKSADNDNDGIRVDTSHHVWIDHCELTRLGDGLVDVRKDSTNVTLSWSYLHDHNKTVGVGWTDNVITEITLHHDRFANTYQRNASIDNVAAGHLYSNHFSGQAHYGTMSRGAAQLLIEHSVYEDGEDAIVAKDEASRVHSRDNVLRAIRGRKDDTGPTFEASEHYAYTADPAADVPDLLAQHAGTLRGRERCPRTLVVALDGTGDTASIGAAVGLAERSGRATEIVVRPGTYREIVRVREGAAGLTIRGESGDPADVVLTYDLAAGTAKFYGGTFGATGASVLAILADDVTVRGITIENAYDEIANGGSQAQALRTVGDRIVLEDVRLLGNQDTFLGESPSKDVISRVYVHRSFVEGDVDFIYGRATIVLDDCEIRSYDRGAGPGGNNGYVAAPATANGRLGILFTACRFTSDADAGTVHLGRPWHPSSDPDVEPSAVIRDSYLGAHIRTPAWSDMSGWPWQDDFLREHANTGPGAVPAGEVVEGRPQLTAQEALEHTREAYLSGEKGWSPWR